MNSQTLSNDMQRDNAENILNVAIELAESGKAVFPISQKKLPVWSNEMLGLQRGMGGLKIATTDTDELERLFLDPKVRKRVAGIGMPTGKINGLTVVDVDCGKGKANREKALAWLEKHRKTTLWGATVVGTQSGGRHYYCRYTEGVPSSANTFGDGIDCRNDGGFVAIPPFMGYKFLRQVDPDDWPAPPPVVKKQIAKDPEDQTGYIGETTPEMMALIEQMRSASAQEGSGWHSSMIRIVAKLVGMGWSDSQILLFVPQWTKGGFTHRQTFEQVAVAIEGAREKWKREETEPWHAAVEEERKTRLFELWNRAHPSTRKAFLKGLGHE